MKKLFIIMYVYFCSHLFASAEMSSITSGTSSVPASITRDEARSLYLLKTRSLNNGQSMAIYQMPQRSSLHREFVRSVLNLTIEQYNKEIDKITNQGLNVKVSVVNSQLEMLEAVASTVNSIGYIDSDNLIIYAGEHDVKTIKIQN